MVDLDTRRGVLLAGLGAVAGCARRFRTSLPLSDRFARVNVAPDRVTRVVTGLRPFRPAGFVVRREPVGAKVLIHNYGHGGGGVTLSWGTSQMAVEMAELAPGASCAVLGSGAVGLATARLLQQRGARVTIYTRDLPPRTTSNIAGAQWWPTSVFDNDRITPEFREQFLRAARLAYDIYQTMVGSRYGIRWLPNYFLSEQPFGDTFMMGTSSPLRDLYPGFRDVPPNEHPFAAPYVRTFYSMMIEPPVYLRALLDDFRASGGSIVVREVRGMEEIAALPESLLFNCTGLGAGALVGDKEIMPIKGQLSVLLPQPEVQYNVLSGGRYMFPRADGILLGGTFQRGEWNLAPDMEIAAQIVSDHQQLFGAMRL